MSEGQGNTVLHFRESLPEEFSLPERNIAGWSLVLLRLKDAIEGREADFSNEKHPEVPEQYRLKIAALKE
ncbi:MAG: hypothetical protein QM657_16535 [Lacrimispora sp.]|uniref:hypothetical protein n=1 Tax=Lacrimispora sp. TaxID=2719234 RepID=UPI0039E633DF